MNDLIREIEEDIRQERFDQLWHSFGKVMIGISLAVILATAAVEWMQHKKQAEAMEYTSLLIKGIDRLNIEDYKGAVQDFSTFDNDKTSTYYGLFKLRKAQAETGLSDRTTAAKTYGELAANDPVFGKLAAVFIQPDVNKDAALIQITPGQPFYYTASELKGWQLLQQGKKDDAVSLFLSLYTDPAAPSSMHSRLGEVLRHIAPDKVPPEIKDMLHE